MWQLLIATPSQDHCDLHFSLSAGRPTGAQSSDGEPVQDALWVTGTEVRGQSLKDDSLSELVAETS